MDRRHRITLVRQLCHSTKVTRPSTSHLALLEQFWVARWVGVTGFKFVHAGQNGSQFATDILVTCSFLHLWWSSSLILVAEGYHYAIIFCPIRTTVQSLYNGTSPYRVPERGAFVRTCSTAPAVWTTVRAQNYIHTYACLKWGQLSIEIGPMVSATESLIVTANWMP